MSDIEARARKRLKEYKAKTEKAENVIARITHEQGDLCIEEPEYIEASDLIEELEEFIVMLEWIVNGEGD
jgi:hypothetical protein